MDAVGFDRFTRSLGWNRTRRGAIRTLAGGALAAVLGRLSLDAAEAACAKAGQKCGKGTKCCAGAACKGGKCRCKGGRKPCGKGCCPAGDACVGGFCVRALGGFGSGPGQLKQPLDVAVDATGRVFVADAGNGRVQLLDARGGFVRQFTEIGIDPPQGVEDGGDGGVLVSTGDGVDRGVVLKLSADDALKDFIGVGTPSGRIAIDAAGGFVYVADLIEHQVIRYDRATLSPKGAFGSQGSGNGQFQFPGGVAVDKAGTVYVADTNNHRIQKFRRDGGFLAAFGSQGSGPGKFDGPTDVAVDRHGFVYVADDGNSRIQKLTPAGKFVAAVGQPGAGPGQFDGLRGIAVDADGVVYAADRDNNRIQRFAPA